MLLTITEDDLIENIQSEFQKQYPLLILDFLKNPSHCDAASAKNERFSACTPIEDIRMFHTSGAIDIGPEKNVWELEHEFFTRFGLCVQVQFQSGNVLPESTNSNALTLGLLSRKAKEATLN